MTLWWLSFADAKLPEGRQFLGAAMVLAADDIVAAVRVAHVLGINPGGEVKGVPFPEDMVPIVPVKWIGRLLSKEDAMAFDVEMASLRRRL